MIDVTLNVEPQDIADVKVGRRASGEAVIWLSGLGMVLVIDLTPAQARDLVDQLLTAAVSK